MARMVWHNRMAIEGLCAAHEDQELKADFECFATAYCTMTSCSQLSAQGDRLRRVLSAFNRQRLAVEKESWPRAGLTQLASQYKPGLLPPPMPSEYVEEGVCWWNWGRHTRHEDWLGHGYFWRPRPDGHAESLDNMAGSSADDFDMLEGGYRKLLGAKVCRHRPVQSLFQCLARCEQTAAALIWNELSAVVVVVRCFSQIMS